MPMSALIRMVLNSPSGIRRTERYPGANSVLRMPVTMVAPLRNTERSSTT
jgi:hypothetical protein